MMERVYKSTKTTMLLLIFLFFVSAIVAFNTQTTKAAIITDQYKCVESTRTKTAKKRPNGGIYYVYSAWNTTVHIYSSNKSTNLELKKISCTKYTKPVATTTQTDSTPSDDGEGGMKPPTGYGGTGSGASAGNTLSCSNVTNHFSKFYDYVNSKYKSVNSAGKDADKKTKENWVATDKALLDQRAKEDANVQATADKLTALAGSDATKQTAANTYIEALKVAIQDNRHFSDLARSGVDLTADTAGAAQAESYRAQVIGVMNDKRVEYKGFMSKLVKNYDDATTAAKKNCTSATLNKLKNDTKTFKSSFKTDLAKARDSYSKALKTVKEEYKKQIAQGQTDLKTATDTAFNNLLAQW